MAPVSLNFIRYYPLTLKLASHLLSTNEQKVKIKIPPLIDSSPTASCLSLRGDLNEQITGSVSHTSLEFPMISGDREAHKNEELDKVTQIIPPQIATSINHQRTRREGKKKKAQ